VSTGIIWEWSLPSLAQQLRPAALIKVAITLGLTGLLTVLRVLIK
jgi:hypothetical protein